jgi:two-component system, NarL family, nitrate/nitrite response regulator NarL
MPASVTLIGVVVLDKVRLAGEAIAAHLLLLDRFDIIGVAGPDDPQAVDLLKRVPPHVVLVNGSVTTKLIRTVREAAPSAKIVAVGVPRAEESILRLVEAGIDAFLTTDEPLTILPDRLQESIRDEISLSPHLAATLLRRVAELSNATREMPAGLTTRELEVVRLLRLGLSNKEIAHELDIGVSTVKNHVHNILSKLGVRTRTAVVASRAFADED